MNPTGRPKTTAQEVLLEEYMKPNDFSVEDISTLCGLSKMGLHLFLDGRKPMNPYLAEKLASGLGTSVEFWLNLGGQDVT